MPPGASAGAVLIAGPVDSAQAGPGAFYSLHRSQRCDEVRVATADGRVIAYRDNVVVTASPAARASNAPG